MILMCMHWQCCCNIVGVMTHCCRSASYKVMSPMLKPPKKDWQLLTGVDSCAVAASDGISSEVRIRPVHKLTFNGIWEKHPFVYGALWWLKSTLAQVNPSQNVFPLQNFHFLVTKHTTKSVSSFLFFLFYLINRCCATAAAQDLAPSRYGMFLFALVLIILCKIQKV